jgi:predicted 2-oxoglutarate/Fe(II)-dependent dioxygenase YbiX
MILIQKNFIQPKEFDLILNAIKTIGSPPNLAEGDPATGYYGKSSLLESDVFAYGIFNEICERVLGLAEKVFDLSLKLDQATLIKVVPGNTTEEHADSQNLDGTPKMGCSNFCISAVAYLNEDFTGGDLVFPTMQHRYKPVPGDCVVFPSHLQYSHYVDSVFSGERMSAAMWFSKV